MTLSPWKEGCFQANSETKYSVLKCDSHCDDDCVFSASSANTAGLGEKSITSFQTSSVKRGHQCW